MAKQMKIDRLNAIPEDAEAGTVEEFMYKDGVKDILAKLDNDMVGLIPVKSRVREIAALLVVDKLRRNLGLDTSVPSLHMCFTGAPGTGKTTVAMRMGQILQRMGYCRSGHLVVATRDDLVGQYVGHTAPKTKEVIKKAMGGVLLIDEAYYLYNASNDRDYGQESIEILLNVMEENREDIVVILAGYKDKWTNFFHLSQVCHRVSEITSNSPIMRLKNCFQLLKLWLEILNMKCHLQLNLFSSNTLKKE
jgi:probable Rubsico expression protein CbbX